jgi:hypothetical protein
MHRQDPLIAVSVPGDRGAVHGHNSLSPIQCAPAPGTLTISGSDGNVISYARVR